VRSLVIFFALFVLFAVAASATRIGRYPLTGVRGSHTGAISSTTTTSRGCTFPATMPCTFGG